MAQEVLKLHLYGMEEDNLEIPVASSIKNLSENEKLASNEVFVMINVAMSTFRDKQNQKYAATYNAAI